MTVKLAILDDYQNVARQYADWSPLAGRAEIAVFEDHIGDVEPLVARLRGFHALCLTRERTPITRALMDRLPDLKLVVTTGFRNNAIDIAAARKRGVVVCGTRVQTSETTTELAWGLIFGLLRHIPFEAQAMREGRWQSTVGLSVKGMTLGIVGLGKLGARLAKVAHAFEMNVIAWSENLTADRAAQHGARLVTKQQLFAESDIVSIHLFLGERTRKTVGAEELAVMKPTAYLINTARGPIVDEAALIDTLSRRRIAGAALDVFDVEPLPADHPLRKLDNVILTPHIGGVTQDRYSGRYGDVVDDVRAWLDGKPIRQLDLNGEVSPEERG